MIVVVNGVDVKAVTLTESWQDISLSRGELRSHSGGESQGQRVLEFITLNIENLQLPQTGDSRKMAFAITDIN